jgi:TonB family protein
LGADNGGILVNLSEGGVGFQSVAPLELGQTMILKFKLPGEKNHLESRAEVVWSNESGKSGGLRFVELSADARAQIRAWAENESAGEAAPEIHPAETSGDSIPTEKRSSPERSQPSPMGEIRGPRSTPRANIPPEAPTRVASARAPVRSEIHDTAPAADTVHWVWREPYLAALRDQNSFSLRERLLTAEKAILFRMKVLHGAPDDLPELQALREALNSLYAREPNKSPRSPRIVEDQGGYEWGQRNWTKLAAVAAVAVIVSFAIGWILASKNFGNDIQSIRTATEPEESITNSDNEFASVRDVHILDTPPQELRTPPKDNGAIAPLKNTPSHHLTEESPSRPFRSLPAEPERGGTTSHQSSDQPKEAPEVRAEPQASPLPSIPPAAERPISQGSVTVSFSTYPSLRIPPEVRSQAVGAKLQIGQVVSRIDPIYPEDAERQRIEGTVNLQAIIGTDGSVKGLEGISGPPLLVRAAASAVLQWRYQPTLLSDQPIETAQDVTIMFRLLRNAASAN